MTASDVSGGTRRVAVVTGGSGAIGRAISQHLSGAGLLVVVGYRTAKADAQEVVSSLIGDGHIAWPVSVTERDSLVSLSEMVSQDLGRLDVLVNCAGVTRPVPHDDLESLDDDLFDHILKVNVRGAFAAIRVMRPLLDQAGGGVVVNISSVSAVTGMGSNVAYCASKAALDSMTRSLGRALAPSIRVVSVSPGFVEGPFTRDLPAAFLDAQRGQTPLGRLAKGEDVARAVLAVVDGLTFSTGCVVSVDGGRPLGTR